MDRRSFLRAGTLGAGLTAAPASLFSFGLDGAANSVPEVGRIPKRPLGRTGRELSILGLGGIVVMNAKQGVANGTVAEAVDAGINYVDVAPSYGDAQRLLGPALRPYRDKMFLACKTGKRDRAGAAAALDNSLQLLKTDHVDLYQHHAVTTMNDVEQILGPGGANEAFIAGQKAGKIRHLGFSAHSPEAAVALMDRFNFDTVLFPINFVLFYQSHFGPQVIKRATEKGMGIMAIKSMAKTTWPVNVPQSERPNPKCWYEPCELPEEAALALRWTLSQPITAAIPPGDERFFPLAMYLARNFVSVRPDEEKLLMARAAGVKPIFPQTHA
jgi:aryl-alcohol dehydrogenase-like predicted oxidoreductase